MTDKQFYTYLLYSLLAVLAVIAVVTTVAVAILTGDDDRQARSALVADAMEADADHPYVPAAPPVAQFVEGNPVTNGGITVTVTGSSSPESYARLSNSTEKNSGYDEYENVTPREGGKFVRVDATVKNGTREAIDPSCNLPMFAYVTDGYSQYSPVEDEHEIQGTPDCGEKVNPGFTYSMVWIFEVPTSVKIAAFQFSDYEEPSGSPTSVVLKRPL